MPKVFIIHADSSTRSLTARQLVEMLAEIPDSLLDHEIVVTDSGPKHPDTWWIVPTSIKVEG